MYLQDTIAAISTPCGEGGIGVIRISGSDSLRILKSIFVRNNNGDFSSHRFFYGQIIDPVSGLSIDESMAVYMKAPKSFTREDVVELQCHSGTVVMQKVLSLVLKAGARLAEPGEFIRRAFLNGRIDLPQAEGVIDVIRARTDAALLVANSSRSGLFSSHLESIQSDLKSALALIEAYIDFPDEDLQVTDSKVLLDFLKSSFDKVSSLLVNCSEGRSLRDGVSVTIAGKPNVGKSSLLNALLREKRAIVTSVPGTTRDFIEEIVNISGLPVRLLDTAGIRETDDPVEAEGIKLAKERLAVSDLVLFLLDGSSPFDSDDLHVYESVRSCNFIIVLNKADLVTAIQLPDELCSVPTVSISTFSESTIDDLKAVIASRFLHGKSPDSREEVFVSNIRHIDLLQRVHQILFDLLSVDLLSYPSELFAADLRDALDQLGQVSGATTPDDILDIIFSQFCIGK